MKCTVHDLEAMDTNHSVQDFFVTHGFYSGDTYT